MRNSKALLCWRRAGNAPSPHRTALAQQTRLRSFLQGHSVCTSRAKTPVSVGLSSRFPTTLSQETECLVAWISCVLTRGQGKNAQDRKNTLCRSMFLGTKRNANHLLQHPSCLEWRKRRTPTGLDGAVVMRRWRQLLVVERTVFWLVGDGWC